MNRRWNGIAGPIGTGVGVLLSLMAGACSQQRAPQGISGGDETGDVSSSGTPGTTSTGSSSSEDESSEGDVVDPPRYDVGAIPDAPIGECGGGSGGDPAFSYIWIANSQEGTISKIDTVTMEEVGRYHTGPGTWEDPSRTSVSLNGNVAVANRNGGVASFYARIEDCVDRNGNGSIDTSTGSNDVLAWDDEECRAWYTPFDYQSQRPVAWAPGVFNPSTCKYSDEKLWTSGSGGWGQKPIPDPKGGGDGSVDVVLIDGETGDVEETVSVPGVPFDGFGLYGGAVDGNGNFWGSQLGQGKLVRVDRDTFEPSVWDMGANGYGMTVDHQGNVWVCSHEVGRFDPETETWQTASVGGGGGCMEDGEGTLWLASSPLVGVDIDTLEVVQSIQLPSYVHGVSVDFQGNVWGVTMMESQAFRVNPQNGEIDTFTGLTGPYTYSDMTGFALANAGGWAPAG